MGNCCRFPCNELYLSSNICCGCCSICGDLLPAPSQWAVSVFKGLPLLLLQLGAVCGSEGDCCRRLDDLAGAEQHYLAAVEHLQTCER